MPIVNRVRRLGESSRWTSPEAQNDLRRALLSIYLYVVGPNFHIRGPASVLLPPGISPMSLSHALAVISASPVRLREVLWRIVAGVPVHFPPEAAGLIDRYPSAITKYFVGRDLADLDRLRHDYRRNAGAFIAALLAVRDDNFDLARDLIDWMDRRRGRRSRHERHGTINFSTGLEDILGVADTEYLRRMLPPQADRPPKPRRLDAALHRLARQIAGLESEMDTGVQQIVDNLADVAAFEKFTHGLFQDTRIDRVITVYPSCTSIVQDARTMLTRVTTTSIVKGPFKAIVDAIDPAHWARSSDIIQVSRYVRDPISRKPVKTPPGARQSPDQDVHSPRPRFLEEDVLTSWNPAGDQRATYHNVLNVLVSTRSKRMQANVTYNLCRSVNSAVLWDDGPGGLLLDEGYIKLRPLVGRDMWRLTMRKQVEFGDRFGAGNRPIPGDLLQTVSYLAPAFISLYVECAMNSVADTGWPAVAPGSDGGTRPGVTPRTHQQPDDLTNPTGAHHGGKS